jgi:MOSC domain-containing protein YiiM
MTSTIAGIAIRTAPKAAPEKLDRSDLTVAAGLPGNFRGVEKARRRRQVTLVHARDWRDACVEAGCALDWSLRRCDLLVDGDPLPMEEGALIRVGTAVLEITGECDPCVRMDAIHSGLRAALVPGWRGGRLARVVQEGHVEIGSVVARLDASAEESAVA